MPLLLVRHAQAKARKEWSGDDRLRPLTGHGFRQADGLVSIAAEFVPVTRILSSPYQRCEQTLRPLAVRRGLEVELDDALAEGQRADAVRLVRELAGQDVAVCTHGDVIVEILVSLADEDHVDLGASPKQAKGSVWVLEGADGRFRSADYRPPVVAERV